MRNLLMKMLVVAAIVPVAALVAGCGQQKKNDSVKIDGSSTVYPITAAVAEEFLKDKPQVRVTVGVSGTGGGFKKFIQGELDLCDASRGIKDAEREACVKAGVKFITLEVAYDGLAVVVHPENDWAACLTVEQLKKLWQPESEVKKWSDLDPAWPAEEIKLYGPGTDSGTFDYFTKAIVGEEKASRSDYTASEDDNVLVRGVTADKYALGYFGYAYYAENKETLKLVGIDDGSGSCVTPSTATVRDGSYKPLSRPLYLYVKTSSLNRPVVAEFVQYYLKRAEQLVTEVGYVPVSVEQQQRNEQLVQEALGKSKSSAGDADKTEKPAA